MADLKYWIWLTSRTGIGPRGAYRLIEQFGSPEAVYLANSQDYNRIPDLSARAKESLRWKNLDEMDCVLGDCDRLGIRIMTCQDADYPERLRNIKDRPLVLYCKGKKIAFDQEVTVAMVGTRSCSPYGIQVGGELAMNLSRCGAVVVSGIAEGIDSAVVRGALKGGGPVVCVLGGGIDVRYPASSAPLYEDVAAVGCLISEYPPGTEPKGEHFPVRNRIISGLSLGVIVVESALKGGSMITVSHAIEQNRDVFSVPGSWGAPASDGANWLVSRGDARLIRSVWDIVEEYEDHFPGKLDPSKILGQRIGAQRMESLPRTGKPPKAKRLKEKLPKEKPPKEKPPKEKPLAEPRQASAEKAVDKDESVGYILWREHREHLTEDQRDVLLVLDGGALNAEELIERTRLPVRRVLTSLTLLQMQGLVAETTDKRFQGKVRLKMD